MERDGEEPGPRVHLPNTSPGNRRGNSYVRVLHRVHAEAWNLSGFDGPLYPAGGKVPLDELLKHPVVIECAGPQGTFKRGQHRHWLWVLWRWDAQEHVWREIARALALNSSWVAILREPAIRAIGGESPGAADLELRAREVAERIMIEIGDALAAENHEVRRQAMASIYERLAGRIVGK